MQRSKSRSSDGQTVAEGTDVDDRLGGTGADSGSEQADSPGRIGMDGTLLSAKAFGLSIVLLAVGAIAGGAIPLVGVVGRLVGVFVAAFVVGLLASRSRYLETTIAGAIILAASFAFGLLSVGVLPVGLDFLSQYGLGFSALGAAIGGGISAVGHYFGRDLRAGLTEEIS